MKINVHIERLVLEGLSLTSHQGPALGEALRAELARLLSEGGLPLHVTAGGVIPRLDGGVFARAQGAPAEGVGRQLAQSVAEALRR